MVLPTETLKSMLPQDIPWWKPDYAIFFGALYLALFAVGLGLTYVAFKTYRDVKKNK